MPSRSPAERSGSLPFPRRCRIGGRSQKKPSHHACQPAHKCQTFAFGTAGEMAAAASRSVGKDETSTVRQVQQMALGGASMNVLLKLAGAIALATTMVVVPA